jgi:hypothetical protein
METESHAMTQVVESKLKLKRMQIAEI